ncbi:MAG: hypothetical protein AMS27_03695 [Bacteroides sp. SM23_62_1]|nr:MAG: hypothetical protein AMS27_03695 [Bacteroides sp. SM23_62_1]
MWRWITGFLFYLSFIPLAAQAQAPGKISREEYILVYKGIAIAEMNRSGIPASITLAQGMVESDNGNSRLAMKANNHFGIKCHGWKGKKIYHDDDERNECFRKYKSAEESYIDHTDFLMNSPRYEALFYLDQTDYKGWAKGLKRAGYATSSTYADALIRVIEENELYKYDEPIRRRRTDELAQADIEEFTVEIPHRKILTRNRINYIIVQDGDTYNGLSEEFDMMPFELAKYNEIERNAKLVPGQVLYIQPKRNKASVEFKHHTVEEGETMYQISQMYGIKLHKLYKKNLMKEGTEPAPGDVLWLRQKNKVEEETVLEDETEVEFEW